ncbi:MAG: MarR family transcriptional regulator [Candidatus Solibacter sp.]
MTIVVANDYYWDMAGRIQKELQQTKAAHSLEEEALLNIVRTADVLSIGFGDLLKPHGLSGTQYNVLRILRGAGEEGVSCKEIGARLLTRDPDITRLMDRLEQRSLIVRDRAKEDRRVVTHRLSDGGRVLVNQLDGPIDAHNKQSLGHLSPAKLHQLVRLLEEVRESR